MGILWGFPQDFSVGMGWVWGLKFNPHGSLAFFAIKMHEICIKPCIFTFKKNWDPTSSGEGTVKPATDTHLTRGLRQCDILLLSVNSHSVMWDCGSYLVWVYLFILLGFALTGTDIEWSKNYTT